MEYSFEEALREVDVQVVVQPKPVRPRQPHARLRRLVKNDIDTVEHWAELGRQQICLDEFESGRC